MALKTQTFSIRLTPCPRNVKNRNYFANVGKPKIIREILNQKHQLLKNVRKRREGAQIVKLSAKILFLSHSISSFSK